MLNMPTPAELAAMAAAQPQPMALNVASPLNDIQAVVLAASNILRSSAGMSTPKQAVIAAREMFVEAVVAETRQALRVMVDERLKPTEKTPAGEQFIIPGTR